MTRTESTWSRKTPRSSSQFLARGTAWPGLHLQSPPRPPQANGSWPGRRQEIHARRGHARRRARSRSCQSPAVRQTSRCSISAPRCRKRGPLVRRSPSFRQFLVCSRILRTACFMWTPRRVFPSIAPYPAHRLPRRRHPCGKALLQNFRGQKPNNRAKRPSPRNPACKRQKPV
jgi:hypothetical protein